METSDVVRRPPFGSNPVVGERGSDTRRTILTAAMEVFAEVGFSNSRVELITERAGCSRPAFYQYFSSKEDVFWRLAATLGREMVSVAESLERVTPDEAGVETLTSWVDQFMRLYGTYAPVFTAFQSASRDDTPRAQSSSGISDMTGAALLRAFGIRRSNASSRLSTAMVAVLIRCSFYELYAASVSEGLDHDQLVRTLSQLLHRLFAGPIEGVNTMRSGTAPAAPTAAASIPATDADEPLGTRGARTRQRLLDAGAAVLPSRGYHDTRVDDLVEAAGVSHGTFYRYFDNKDDFFRSLAAQAATAMIDLLDRFPADADPAVLRAWSGEWFETYRVNGGVISTWQEMHTTPELSEFSQEIAAAVLSRLVRVLERRDFGDPLLDGIVFLALVERLPYSVFTLHFTDEPDAIETMLTIIRRGLLAIPEPE